MSGGSTETAAAAWRPSVSPWLVAGAVMLAVFMEVLDTTIVSVALPNIAGSLAATNEEATWVLTSYLVANAIVLPASGWLAQRFGRRRLLLACTALFTSASFLCAITPSMPVLILARILQGLGGGAMQPLSQAILLESFPREKQGMAMAVFGMGVVGAPIIGPFIGGWLTDNYSWRWVFDINIPIGILAIVLIAACVEDPPYIRNAKPGKIDGIGLGLLAVWLATLQIVLDKGQQEDWFASSWIAWFSVISLAALAALIGRELRAPEPIIGLRVFLDRNFSVGNAVQMVVMGAMYSALAMLPLFLQTLLGYTSQNAGLATAPRGIGSMIAMPVVGALTDLRAPDRIRLQGRIPATRREHTEAAVAGAAQRLAQPYEAWIAADPFTGGVRVLTTGPRGFERTVAFALDEAAAATLRYRRPLTGNLNCGFSTTK